MNWKITISDGLDIDINVKTDVNVKGLYKDMMLVLGGLGDDENKVTEVELDGTALFDELISELELPMVTVRDVVMVELVTTDEETLVLNETAKLELDGIELDGKPLEGEIVAELMVDATTLELGFCDGPAVVENVVELMEPSLPLLDVPALVVVAKEVIAVPLLLVVELM